WSFFFFSSRRRHTRFSRDWSSDVCSSDLSICRRLSEPVRHALVLCVCGIPANILPSRVTELMSALRPFARGRMVRLASPQLGNKIGRASCRERGEGSGGGGTLRERRRRRG